MKGVLNTYAHFEQMQKGLETFFQDADKGKKKFEELRKLSNETTFGVDELANSFTQLANVGVNVDTINQKLIMLGNIAGGDKAKFADLVSIYSKIQSTGKAGAMQLQQIAMRGVPIYDMLKKIGVQGTATGKDITKAFEEMTKQGGQFYNAMNNINETIGGKEGFISDYMKELSVNFADLTGLADAYKNALDFIKEKIGEISDKFLEWNNNPVIKALLQDKIKIGLAGIAGILVGAIIPALGTVISLLGAVNPAIWISGIASAGITALSLGNKRRNKAEDTALGIASPEKTEDKYLDTLNQRYVSIQRTIAKLKNDFESLGEAQKQTWTPDDVKAYADELRDLNKELDFVKNAIDEYNKKMAEARRMHGFSSGREKSLSGKSTTSTLATQFDDFKDLIEQYSKNKLVDELKTYQDDLKTLTENATKEFYRIDKNGKKIKLELDESQKAKLEKDIETLKNKIKELNIKIGIDELSDWQKEIKRVSGISDEKALSLKGSGGKEWIDSIVKGITEASERQKATDKLMGFGGTDSSYIAQQATAVKAIYDNLMKSAVAFGVDDKGKLDNSTQALKDTLDNLKETYLEKGGTEEEWGELLGKVDEITEKVSPLQNFVNTITQGTEVGKLMNMPEGASVEEMVINLLLEDLAEVVGGFDSLKLALNPVKTILYGFSPLLKAIVNTMAIFGVALKALADWLNSWLDGIFGDYNNAIQEVIDANTEQAESQRRLNEEYKKLQDSIREQEEYYLKKRTELNAWSLENYANSTQVNDMILTPHGNFSTHPNDTIIATKDPASLGNSVAVTVNNYSDSHVDVKERNNNGIKELLVTISRKIASDVADGVNGWDGAFNARSARIAGRSI